MLGKYIKHPENQVLQKACKLTFFKKKFCTGKKMYNLKRKKGKQQEKQRILQGTASKKKKIPIEGGNTCRVATGSCLKP